MEHLGRTEWFNTSCVVRKVLGYFSNPEALDFSLVSKTWNYEAKSLLKSRGRTLAKFKHFKTCRDLAKFAKTLEAMSAVVPYSGLSIHASLYHSGSCAHFDQSRFNMVSSVVPLKVFRVAIEGENTKRTFMRWIPKKSCSAIECVNQMLRINAHQIVELSIVIPSLTTLSLESIPGFPQLKILKFNCGTLSAQSSQLDLLKHVVDNCPQLEQLHLPNHLDTASWLTEVVSKVLLHGSRAVLVCDRIELPKQSELPVECLQHLAVRHVDRRMDRMLWHSSSRTVEAATLDSWSITQIVLDRTSFTNMEKVQLDLNSHFLQSVNGTVIFSKVAWTRAFPSLKSLAVSVSSTKDRQYCKNMTELMRMLDQVKDDSHESKGEETLLNVKRLRAVDKARRNYFSESELSFLVDLCPNVEHLSLENLEPFLGLFVTHLEYISHLELVISSSDNMDWILCGIHPKEADELRQIQAKDLRSLNVVPTRESITNLTYLKTLTFQVCPRNLCREKFIFSTLAAGLCFSRMPGLTVKLHIPDSLSQAAILEDFVNVMKEFPEIQVED